MTSLKEQALQAFAAFCGRTVESVSHYTSDDIRQTITERAGFNNWASLDLRVRGNSNAFWEAVIKWCPVPAKTSEQIENERLGAIWELEIDALEEDAEGQYGSDSMELNEIQDYLNDLEKAIVLDATNLPNASLPSNVTGKAKRALTQIAGISLEMFQMPSGVYAMSQSQMSSSIGEDEKNGRRFISQKYSEYLPNKVYTPGTFEVEKDLSSYRGSSRIVPVGITLAFEFWASRAFKGNVKAQALVIACGQETLQRRCDNVFGIAKTEQQYEHQSSIALSQWQEARVKLRETHNNFTNACVRYGFSAALAHDKLTKAICGKSAKELREMELINGQWDIGLNHLDDLQDIKRVGRMKYHFSRYQKGTVDDRVSRAKKDVLKEKDTL